MSLAEVLRAAVVVIDSNRAHAEGLAGAQHSPLGASLIVPRPTSESREFSSVCAVS